MPANREYKSSVFTFLFSDKDKLIELYNAIEGTHYSAEDKIEITTLEKVLYADRYNDISFTINGKYVVLLEHQSTINNNLPLRSLLYIARTYEKLIDNKSIYKEALIKIPTPEIYVLYNGVKPYPKETELKLSDAFIEDGSALELKVKVLNINYDDKAQILEKSQTLRGYSYFVKQVRKYTQKGYTLNESIETAIKLCIEENILRDFLERNSSEVTNMLYTEFNLEDARAVWEEEAEKRGVEIGEKRGVEIGEKRGVEIGEKRGEKRGVEIGEKRAIQKIAVHLLEILDEETISLKTGLTLEEIADLKKNGFHD